MPEDQMLGKQGGDHQTESAVLQIDIQALDQPGLVHEVSEILYDLGANLADTSFVVLGQGCRLTSLAEFAPPIDGDDLLDRLKGCRLLNGASVSVSSFDASLQRRDSALITHRLFIEGGDRPGLVQRISEVIVDHGGNIVRLNAHREEHPSGTHYVTRFALHIPVDELERLDNAISNIAGTLRLKAKLIENG